MSMKRCQNEDGMCRGPVKTVTDPYRLEIHNESVKITVCEAHLQERRDEI